MKAVPCAHAVLRRALLSEVDIEQPQRLEQPTVALNVTQAVLHPQCSVCGDGRSVGAWGIGAWRRPPCFRRYSLALQTAPPQAPPILTSPARAPAHTRRGRSPWRASSAPQTRSRRTVAEASGCRPPALQPQCRRLERRRASALEPPESGLEPPESRTLGRRRRLPARSREAWLTRGHRRCWGRPRGSCAPQMQGLPRKAQGAHLVSAPPGHAALRGPPAGPPQRWAEERLSYAAAAERYKRTSYNYLYHVCVGVKLMT